MVLALPWLTREYGVRPIVLVRHPAGVVSSLRLKGWRFPLQDLLGQPALSEIVGGDLMREVEVLWYEDPSFSAECALGWRLLHEAIAALQADSPGWVVARHEDLSRSPASGFAGLAERLGLAFDNAMRLLAHEVARIRALGEPTASRFYADEDW